MDSSKGDFLAAGAPLGPGEAALPLSWDIAVPKVDLPGPYRFHFFSHEPNERAHVHVKREAAICKFWLRPVFLVQNHGFAAHELNRIERLVEKHRLTIEQAWHEHFRDVR